MPRKPNVSKKKKISEDYNIFSSFSEMSDESFVLLKTDGKIIYANPAFHRLIDEDKPEDTYTRSIFNYFPGKEASALFRDEIIPMVTSGRPWTGNMILGGKHNKPVNAEIKIFPIRDGKDAPIYFGTIIKEAPDTRIHAGINDLKTFMQDISGQSSKASGTDKDYIHTSGGKLDSLIFHTIPVAVSILHHRKYIKVNRMQCNMVGFTENELIGRTTHLVFASDSEFERVGRELYSMIDRDGIGMIETQLKHKNGGILDVLIYASRLDPADPSGRVVTVLLDISKRKRTEEALYATERKLAEIFRVSPEFISVSTLEDGRFMETNDAVVRLLGYSREELIGHTTEDINLW